MTKNLRRHAKESCIEFAITCPHNMQLTYPQQFICKEFKDLFDTSCLTHSQESKFLLLGLHKLLVEAKLTIA